MEVAQSDAAAAMDWLRSETWRAYERPDDEVTGNPSDDYERRAPGTAGMRGGVRYQFYETKDGHVLFMASEREFWKNFCDGVGRPDLFEAHPGSRYADHGGLDRVRRSRQHADRAGEHAEDARRRPAVPGTDELGRSRSLGGRATAEPPQARG